jgi:alpha-ketoglutarate-dependent taurine dioxygenase
MALNKVLANVQKHAESGYSCCGEGGLAMSCPNIESTGATLGAIVTGVDLSDLCDTEWRTIESAFHDYAVLVFPGQFLSSLAQVAFARRFGDLEHIYGDTGLVPISNRRQDGTLLDDHEPGMQIMLGNEGWHTDSSYMPLAAKASLLSAHVVPTAGGQTEWADMRAAYCELDHELCERIANFSAYHSLVHSQARVGFKEPLRGGYGFAVEDPPLRPLIKVHPITGRPSLFIGRHAYGIPGLDPAESEMLLDELMDFACRPPRCYQHQWEPGDIAIWDNRCVMHRARPFDHDEPRVMKHTRVAGDPASELAVY